MSSILNHIAKKCEITGFHTIEIEHDGHVGWLEMQELKNKVWGESAIAFEMYPPKSEVVNGGSTEFHYRHLWLWPENTDWPNIRPE